MEPSWPYLQHLFCAWQFKTINCASFPRCTFLSGLSYWKEENAIPISNRMYSCFSLKLWLKQVAAHLSSIHFRKILFIPLRCASW